MAFTSSFRKCNFDIEVYLPHPSNCKCRSIGYLEGSRGSGGFPSTNVLSALFFWSCSKPTKRPILVGRDNIRLRDWERRRLGARQGSMGSPRCARRCSSQGGTGQAGGGWE